MTVFRQKLAKGVSGEIFKAWIWKVHHRIPPTRYFFQNSESKNFFRWHTIPIFAWRGPVFWSFFFFKMSGWVCTFEIVWHYGGVWASFGEIFWLFCAQPGVQKPQKLSFLAFSPDFFWKIGLVCLQLVSICAALSSNIPSICLCSFWIEQGQVTAKSAKNPFQISRASAGMVPERNHYGPRE